MRFASGVLGVAGAVLGFVISISNVFADLIALFTGLDFVFLLLVNIALTVLFLVAIAGATLILGGYLRTGACTLAVSTLGTVVLGYFQLPPYIRPFGPEIPEGFETLSPFIYPITATPLLVAATAIAIIAAIRASEL